MSRCFPIVNNHSTTKRNLYDDDNVEQKERDDDGAKAGAVPVTNTLQSANIDGIESKPEASKFRGVESGSGTKRFGVTFRLDDDAADPRSVVKEMLVSMKMNPRDEMLVISKIEFLTKAIIDDGSGDSEYAYAFAIRGGIRLLMTVMKMHMRSTQLLIKAFKLIQELTLFDHISAMLRLAPVSDCVLRAMKFHFKDADLVKEACNTLEYIADNEDEPGRWCPADDSDVNLSLVLSAMAKHIDNVSLQIDVCSLLNHMAKDAENADLMMMLGIEQYITRALDKHAEHRELVLIALSVLYNIGRIDEHAVILCNPGLMSKVLWAMNCQLSNKGVQRAAINTLTCLHAPFDHDEEYDVDIEIFKRIAAIMSKFEDDVDIQTSACDLLIMLSCGPRNTYKLLKSNVLDQVEVARIKFPDQLAERFDHLLSHVMSSLVDIIGADEPQVHVQAHVQHEGHCGHSAPSA